MAQLRDLTSGPRILPVEVAWSPAYEVLTALWALSDKEQCSSLECGQELRDEVRGLLDPGVARELDDLSEHHGLLWLALFGVVHGQNDSADAHILAGFVASDEPALRRALLEVLPGDGSVDIDTALAGPDGLAAYLGTLPAQKQSAGIPALVTQWLSLPDGQLAERVASVIREVGGALAGHLDTYRDGLRRDARGTAALALTMPPEELIESATNGIAYEPAPGIEGVRLVPSAVVRPWSLMMEHERVRTFIYPVGGEYLDADPDAPPAWLVDIYKALGDEKRLRILGRLGRSGAATLAEIAELIDLGKSTAHHHIGILRSAGLVSVSISETKETTYRLRPQSLPAAQRVLAQFLSGEGL
jgi:DNA-binding transcriptional ArsR family regulator